MSARTAAVSVRPFRSVLPEEAILFSVLSRYAQRAMMMRTLTI